MANWRLWRARVREEAQAALEQFRKPIDAPPQPPSAHLLAISDLHLGHDLKRGCSPALGEIPATDRHLGAFLEHYRTNREGGLPWRLIMVGDVVDFIAITITPRDDELVPFQVSDEERLYGLGTEPEKARWKLERVFERHAFFFARLARFLAEGNELVIVRGNHDPEWSWPEVRETFLERLAQLAPGLPATQEGDRVAATLRARIRFCDWFYLEPGRFYAEHGHFYDEFSVSDEMMPTPRISDGGRVIPEPVSTLAHRYFANKHSSLDLNEVERWTLTDFLRWGYRGGRMLSLLGDYLAMCGRVLSFSFKASYSTTRRSLRALFRTRSDERDWREDRVERIRSALQAVRSEYAGLARSLFALTRPPAEQSVLATAQMLYFDRFVLAGVSCILAGSCTAIAETSGRRAGALAAVLVGTVLANLWLSRARLVDSHPKLIAAAHRVADLFRVPVVVMGHSHRVVNQRVGRASHYYNLGTWLTPSREEESGRSGFPHVVVNSAGHAFRRWLVEVDPPAVGEVA